MAHSDETRILVVSWFDYEINSFSERSESNKVSWPEISLDDAPSYSMTSWFSYEGDYCTEACKPSMADWASPPPIVAPFEDCQGSPALVKEGPKKFLIDSEETRSHDRKARPCWDWSLPLVLLHQRRLKIGKCQLGNLPLLRQRKERLLTKKVLARKYDLLFIIHESQHSLASP